ncbi:2-C-methyl-D-erythritol 2,4-cyclodiphosphate synthase [Geovibrio thiophilus]|uniref:2-C-methyl-D-erythritol 2,4-cyclodiphosphate synthase n=1 Tax=Geovibrio thiophilus TaxID=139438 RepID=A0A410K263_9BACT|nr:2-C-methyl-D-erythritol 2,4-cyclodiphosphate synthase [Geovibrio thiophilus]
MRVGNGLDAHRFAEERRLIVGGVDIPYDKGLAGHSDADVLLHAVTDAIAGAALHTDIGGLFPDTDNKYKGIDSRILLREAVRLAAEKGWRVVNSDSVIIAQAPKMAPYIYDMRKNIAEDLGIDIDEVSVKATTTEKMGFTGRGEGIAASATVLIEKI